MRKIGDFEIVDHGILYSVICGSGSFKYVVTGFGDDMAEAIHDCLQQIWGHDFNIEDMEKRILKQMNWDAFPEKPFIDRKDKEQKRQVEYYIVSIRWNELLPIRLGGLMRCCIKTLEKATGKNIVSCQQCDTLMHVKNGAWEWVQ